ncbi:endonuclease/exonuclease/phosphatase family protein [Acinetobacter junii]|jgi:endonuclease/exonuclease/phosphatase (EEP) superfamily protein YafD|uniref:Endonuclease/exonuclease/phosphatase family protein n=1 Tax=Acinetobacter junii TaxID=40215 RepID=A0AAW5RCE3_ACIJU|nr:endonuclease/exonuclease/phosphatase family protein [Acinetobacter junii]APU50046.1 endonuclease [Acinetobacter junii]MBL8282396.1 endonuclease/exonuclease/phosphatase family protein [Acinetobacter junii]MCE6005187.1 endonuclease/exonuclease/phosphatase family protein [Acinetobacter junii]MCU4396543.1 endonuclease/exonuclease/phosphatase family protein [Acinetobacter junii]MDH0666154.1 endonuclease/exonuclease/phosphatase family protein [Acinetobacter junii]
MIWIQICAVLVIWLSFWSLIPRDEWWFRGADFPRLQILALGLFSFFAMLFAIPKWTLTTELLFVGLVAAIAYQLKMVLPYTPIWKKQVQKVKPEQINENQQISLLVANVLTPNDKYHLLLEHIDTLKPDVVLTLESDSSWQNALVHIEQDYPYRVPVPLDNLYGMHLYSRLPLHDTEVKFILSDEIPSIHASVTLRSGIQVQLYCLHPKPPSPTEAKDSTLRDAELLIIGDRIKDLDESCIVMGDLNDVAWSRTTRLFQRISGLLDPRVGRYFMNTFHADYRLLRWSLDHIFHSTDFGLVEMKRLSHIGSDHFPIYVVLQTGRIFEQQQQELEQTADDEQEAKEAIQDGIEKAEKEEKIVVDELAQPHKQAMEKESRQGVL